MVRPAVIAWLFVVVVAMAPRAEGCTCVVSPDNCLQLRHAEAVFEATVESIALSSLPPREPRSADEPLPLSGPIRIVTLRDVKSLRGQPQATVVTAAESSACGYEFRAGTRYLIVANRETDGRLSVSECGLTTPLSESRGLQEYLQTLSGPPTETRIWGQVSTATSWVDRFPDYAGVVGSRVSVTGPEQRVVTTGADGWFSFANLRHGTYTLNVDLTGAAPYFGTLKSQVVTLDASQAHACAEERFLAPLRNSISGVVIDEGGMPLQKVHVELQSADALNPLDRSRSGVTTDADGRYRFDDLPPGRYRVGLNIRSTGPMAMAPFVETHAALTASGEPVIALGPGDHVGLAPTTARRLISIAVSGAVRDADGGPVQGVEVSGVLFGEDEKVYPVSPVITDGEGRFPLHLWDGRRYRLAVGPRYTPDAELEFIATGSPLSIMLRRR
jgi:protocatechuate 3,4-dioxygenase beta subunit